MIQFSCTQCGNAMEALKAHGGKKIRCKKCQTLVQVPGQPKSQQTPPSEPVPLTTEPQFQQPPPMTTPEMKPPFQPPPQTIACPSCGEDIPEDAVLCVHCGFNRQTGQHLKTKVKLKRIDVVLGPNPSLTVRLLIMGLLVLLPTLIVVLMLATRAEADTISGGFLCWTLWVALFGLLIGTFDRHWIHRDESNEVVLDILKSVFFIPMPISKSHFLMDYNYVYTDYKELSFGLRRTEFFIVELGNEFDKDKVKIYMSSNQDNMKEYVDALIDAADHLKIKRT